MCFLLRCVIISNIPRVFAHAFRRRLRDTFARRTCGEESRKLKVRKFRSEGIRKNASLEIKD